ALALLDLALPLLDPAFSLGQKHLLPVDPSFLLLEETAHGERRDHRADSDLRRRIPLTGGGDGDGSRPRHRDLVAAHHEHLAQNLVSQPSLHQDDTAEQARQRENWALSQGRPPYPPFCGGRLPRTSWPVTRLPSGVSHATTLGDGLSMT